MSTPLRNVLPIRATEKPSPENTLRKFLRRHFSPHQETQMVDAHQSKGIFLPYPLLGIIVTVGAILMGGIIALEVQVSNLNTTILLRDADQRAAVHDLQEKTEQLQVYIHDDREKLIRLQTRNDEQDRVGKRR